MGSLRSQLLTLRLRFSFCPLAILYQAPGVVFVRDRFDSPNAAGLQTPAHLAENNLTETVGTDAAHCIFHSDRLCAAQPGASAIHREKKMLLPTTGFDIYVPVINSIK